MSEISECEFEDNVNDLIDSFGNTGTDIHSESNVSAIENVNEKTPVKQNEGDEATFNICDRLDSKNIIGNFIELSKCQQIKEKMIQISRQLMLALTNLNINR